MSLSRQMGIGFLVILLVVFVGTLWLNVDNTRIYIERQLEAHAQDTATSLGLSIAPHVSDENSIPIVETMIQAIFDRGYYASINLTDSDGTTIISLANATHTDDVPKWFVQMFPLTAPTTQTEITDGWTYKGDLIVVSNSGYAYTQLFSVAKKSLLLFVIALGATLIFLYYLTHHVLSRPIRELVNQMVEISQQRFEVIEKLPKTPEFKRIATASNIMSRKLAIMFEQIAKQSERYRIFAYIDSVTNLGNRRAFNMSIAQLLSNDGEYAQGYLFIIRASSLGSIHKRLGGKSGDEYLETVAAIILSCANNEKNEPELYRIAGADFALIVHEIDETEAINVSNSLIEKATSIEKSEHTEGVVHVGGAEFNSGMKLPLLLEKVDSALTIALESDKKWELARHSTNIISNESWRLKINKILEDSKCNFVYQPVVDCEDIKKVIYHECFARLPSSEGDTKISMSQLVPASIKLNYAVSLDRLIIQNALKKIPNNEQLIGLNLSRFSLLDAEFTNWLLKTLEDIPSIARKIVLEIPERSIVQNCDLVTDLVYKLKLLDVKIAIEHFGAQLAGIVHLRKIMPQYLKIDGRYTRGISSDADNQLFVNSLISIAKGLSITVIAEMIESEADYIWLRNSGIDLIQGYFISEPKEEL